jgi:hypothetical protein
MTCGFNKITCDFPRATEIKDTPIIQVITVSPSSVIRRRSMGSKHTHTILLREAARGTTRVQGQLHNLTAARNALFRPPPKFPRSQPNRVARNLSIPAPPPARSPRSRRRRRRAKKSRRRAGDPTAVRHESRVVSSRRFRAPSPLVSLHRADPRVVCFDFEVSARVCRSM